MSWGDGEESKNAGEENPTPTDGGKSRELGEISPGLCNFQGPGNVARKEAQAQLMRVL
jgi:hypothetical protein